MVGIYPYFDRYHPEILQKLQTAQAEDKPTLYPDLKKYIGTSYDMIGLSVPIQRKVFQAGYTFSGLDHQAQTLIWAEVWQHSTWYEALSQALFHTIRHRPQTDPLVLWENTRHWVTRVDNWAHSDVLSDIYAWLLERIPGEVFPQLQTWNASDNPWERRQSVVSLLEYSKKREKILPVSKLLGLVKPLLADNDYFVQKGVGWTLREIGNVYPEKMVQFLEKHVHDVKPSAFTAAVEKLDTETKERLKQWRRKSPSTSRKKK